MSKKIFNQRFGSDFEKLSNKDIAGGYPGLNSNLQINKSCLPPLTAADVGLNTVNNTSDLDKPLSTATQTALSLRQLLSEKNQLNGYAGLDAQGKISSSSLPSLALETLSNVSLSTVQNNQILKYDSTASKWINSTASSGGSLSFKGGWNASTNSPQIVSSVGATGDYYKITTAGSTTIDSISSWSVDDWIIFNGVSWDRIVNSAPVVSVNTKTGSVVLNKTDVGLGNVDNISDLNKPLSTATQTALAAKQNVLVSGTTIKTINNTSVLGSGNLDVSFSIVATQLAPNFDLTLLVAWFRCDGGPTSKNFLLSGNNVQQWYSAAPYGAPMIKMAAPAAPILDSNGVSTNNACVSFSSSQAIGGDKLLNPTNASNFQYMSPQTGGFADPFNSSYFAISMLVNLSWVKSTRTRKQCVFGNSIYPGSGTTCYFSGLRTSCFFKDIYYWDVANTGAMTLTTDDTAASTPIYLPSNQWVCVTFCNYAPTWYNGEVYINNKRYNAQLNFYNNIMTYSPSLTIPFFCLNGCLQYQTSGVSTWFQYNSSLKVRELKEFRRNTPFTENEIASIVYDMHTRANLPVMDLSVTSGLMLMQLKSNSNVSLYSSSTAVNTWSDVVNSIGFQSGAQSTAPTLVQNVFGTLPGIKFLTSTTLTITATIDLPINGPFAFFFAFRTPVAIATTANTGFFRFSNNRDSTENWLVFPTSSTVACSVTSNSGQNKAVTDTITVAPDTNYVMAVFWSKRGVNSVILSSGYTKKTTATGTWVVNTYNETLADLTIYIGGNVSQALTLGEIRLYYSASMSTSEIDNIFNELSTTYNAALV